MRAFIFGIIPFFLFMIGARWYYVCKVHLLCDGENTTLITENIPSNLSLNSGEERIIGDFDQFQFKRGDKSPTLSDNNEDFLNEVTDYLNLKEDKGITITGNYLDAEKDIKYGYYENLGQARAAEVRELLIDRGIDEERFTIDYNMIGTNVLSEPLAFDVFDLKSGNGNGISDREIGTEGTNNKLSKLKFTFYDMTYSDANFKSDSDVFIPGKQCKLYADSVKIFLNENPDYSLTIIGHTDSDATKDYNQDLGERRAKNAKEYFKKIGTKGTINTLSMGETQPTANNSTANGKQKNRRVNFVLDN